MKKNDNNFITSMIAHSQIATILFIFIFIINACTARQNDEIIFESENAYDYIKEQISYGPRFPGTSGHEKTQKLIENQLNENGWEVVIQQVDYLGNPIVNIIGKKGVGEPWIILGAHYDTREFADQDSNSNYQNSYVPGANDGGSGVGILLELSRVLENIENKTVWLVFFDQEDNGNINGKDWILGSRAFVDSLDEYPDKVVIIDMVGDADLQLHYERNSDPEIMESIWQTGINLGYGDIFIPEYRFSMLDDHTPFIQAGIPAIDIIDFDYPFWHTTSDTLDKISQESLGIVGRTLEKWIKSIDD